MSLFGLEAEITGPVGDVQSFIPRSIPGSVFKDQPTYVWSCHSGYEAGEASEVISFISFSSVNFALKVSE